jgi:HSP20 family protein
MVQTRWLPLWNQMQQFQNEVNQLFDQYNTPARGLAGTYPPINMWADDDHLYVEAELPGLMQDQLNIFVSDGNQLTIAGERRPCEFEKAAWHRQERGYGKFQRTIPLPLRVDADAVEARLEQGVLLLKLPKSAAARPRKISVKGA